MARRGWPTLEHMAPKLNWDDLAQTPALPLGSWLKTDPWDDKVHMLNAKRYAPMNARDKMPFEVTPIFYKLQRYEAAAYDAGRSRPCCAARERSAGCRARQRPAGSTHEQRRATAGPTAGGGTEPAAVR